MDTASPYLRPLFIDRVCRRIERGDSLNLVAPAGRGRTRFLDDLQQALARRRLVLRADMAAYKKNHRALLAELWRQVRAAGVATAAGDDDMAGLMHALEASSKPVLLLLHRYDALLNNPDLDPAFDLSFFDHLNAIRNHPRMTLLCVTATPHNHAVVFIGGQDHGTSQLDLAREDLPRLSSDEIDAELRRRLPGSGGEEIARLREAVQAGPGRCYAWLEWLAARVADRADEGLPWEHRVRRWQREFSAVAEVVNPGNLRRAFRWLRARLAVLVNGLRGVAGQVTPLGAVAGKLLEAARRWRGKEER